ncbi:MAG TPA: ribose ABC transporter permease [Clostridiales bacterium]|jgi:ribose transport system permease protein|nr:ribose ABC transporter permease [Clostridiales bacterium]
MKNNTFIKGFRKYFKQNLGILIGLFLLCTVVSFMNENFLTTGNIMNVLRQLFINANLSLGMCLVIITGGIDLTVGSTMGLCGTLTAGLIALNGLNIWLAILIGLLLGVLIGAVNGYIITKLDIAPFIVTMAVQMISRGAVYVYTDGLPIRSVQETFNNLGNGYIKGVPVTILYTVFFTIVVWLILSRSRLGRHIYAVGGNRIAAQYSGISITKVNVWVYAISGFLAAFAGIIYCGRMYSGQPTLGLGDEMNAIAAVVLGGTSFSGGIGTIGGVVIGILIIAVLSNALNLLGLNTFWQQIVKGIVILLAVSIDVLKKRQEKPGAKAD